MNEFRCSLQNVLLAALLLLVSACDATPDDNEPATANIAGYNYTEDGIARFYVNGRGGMSIKAYGDGGFLCCVSYPRIWRPGLTAEVRWATVSGLPWGDPTLTWHQATVPIERYEQTGTRMNVHFLPDGEVRILIWNGYPGTEGYNGPDYPSAPPGWPPKPPPEWIEAMEKEFGRARVIADE